MKILLLLIITTQINTEKLFVFQHVRHGARAPWQKVDDNGYDQFGEKWSGLGEITQPGIRMNYLLGVRNKKYYSDFISQEFNPKEILIYSTNINRTMQSVMGQIQGLFPFGKGKELTDKQLEVFEIPYQSNYSSIYSNATETLGNFSLPNNIQLAPVHLFNGDHGGPFLFDMNDKKYCPAIDILKEKGRQTEEVKKIYNDMKENFTNVYGEKLMAFFNITDKDFYLKEENAYEFCDGFISDYTDGRELELFKRETGIDLDELYHYCTNVVFIDIFYYHAVDPDNDILKVGLSPLMRSLISWMDLRIELDKQGKGDYRSYDKPKMVIISGHDTTLSIFMIYLNKIFGSKIVPTTFSSNQFIELVKENGKYYVDYIYNDVSYFNPKIEYSTFKDKILNSEIIKLWSEQEILDFCGGKKEGNKKIYKILTIVFAALTVIGISLLTFQLLNRKRKVEVIEKEVSEQKAILIAT